MNALQSDLLGFIGERRFATVLVDPPWRFTNKTGKVAPEHRRLSRYSTLTLELILFGVKGKKARAPWPRGDDR